MISSLKNTGETTPRSSFHIDHVIKHYTNSLDLFLRWLEKIYRQKLSKLKHGDESTLLFESVKIFKKTKKQIDTPEN